MADIGDVVQRLGRANTQLDRIIDQNSGCCKTPDTVTSGINSSIPAGFKSISIVKTNVNGTATITFADSTAYPLNLEGEGITVSGRKLPAFTITSGGGATWKWIGEK